MHNTSMYVACQLQFLKNVYKSADFFQFTFASPLVILAHLYE